MIDHLRESLSLADEWTFSPCASNLPPTEIPPGMRFSALPADSAGAGFLRRPVNLRPLNGQRAWVRFEATGAETVFFLNGKRFYASSECLLPVEFDISDHTDRLDNQLLVWRGPRPNPAKVPITDRLQPVSLVYAPSITIPDAAVRASVRREQIEVDISLENRTLTSVQAELSLVVLDGESSVAELNIQAVELSAGVMTTLRLLINCPRARHWSPEDAHLYQLAAHLRQSGHTLDLRVTHFGFHELTQKGGAWLLNGQALQLPNSAQIETNLANPHEHFKHLRASGVDLVYLTGAPPNPAVLDAADESGLLLIGGYTAGAIPQQRQDHLLALIRRDRSHPSLLAWQAQTNRAEKNLFFALDPKRPLLRPGQKWSE